MVALLCFGSRSGQAVCDAVASQPVIYVGPDLATFERGFWDPKVSETLVMYHVLQPFRRTSVRACHRDVEVGSDERVWCRGCE